MLLEVLEEALLVGYDIGCTFGGTIAKSSLGEKFATRGCRSCVNAFHGYSHSHKCQTVHHPSVIKGAGLADMEGMERVFSWSNVLAPVIRYASKYLRRVLIDLLFQQWDEDKYSNIATMLFNDYKQALEIITKTSPTVEQELKKLGCTTEDLKTWEREEVEYFATLGQEPEGDVMAIEYVTLLKELRAAE